MVADALTPKTWQARWRRLAVRAPTALLVVGALVGLSANVAPWSRVADLPCGGIPEAIFYAQPVKGHDVVPALTYLCVLILVVMVLPGMKALSVPGKRWKTVVGGLVVGAVYTALSIHAILTLDAQVDRVRECEDHVANPVGAWFQVGVGVSILLSVLLVAVRFWQSARRDRLCQRNGQLDESSPTSGRA